MAHWTKEEVKYLKENYYIMSLDDLAKDLGKSKNSITNKQSVTNKVKQRKTQLELINCPNCKNEINRVEMGYFCKECLIEYDNYGDIKPSLL